MSTFLQLLLAGVAIGSVYGLIALGFLVINHASGIVNFAQGQMLMVGAIAAFILLAQVKVGYVIAVPTVVIVGIALSWAFNHVLIRPLESRKAPPFSLIVGTIAFGTVLAEVAAKVVSDESHGVPPVLPNNTPIKIGDQVTVLPQTLITVVVAWLIVGAVWVFFNRTMVGVSLRAVGVNRIGAAVSGIRVPQMIAVGLAVSIAVTGVAGMLIAPTLGANPRMGLEIGVRAFAAAILGGFDSVYRGMIAGVFIGVIEILASYYISSAFAPTIIYAVMLVALAVQPLRANRDVGARSFRRAKKQLA